MNEHIERFVLDLMEPPGVELVEVEGCDFPVKISAVFEYSSGEWLYVLNGPEDYPGARAYFESIDREIRAQRN